MPVDGAGSSALVRFRDIGVNTLQESSAFAKIRTFSKAYSTQLVTTPMVFSNKYQKLNSLYANENAFLSTSTFGVQRQHNLGAISMLGNNSSSTFLDKQSFSKFLNASPQLQDPTLNHQDITLVSPSMPTKENLPSTSLDSTRRSFLLMRAGGDISKSRSS
jgi:hypothetical protein